MNATRAASLVLAIGAVTLVILDRRALDNGLPWVVRTGLALLTVGTIGAVTHGLAIAAQSKLLQFVAAPRVAWPAIIAGAFCLVVVENLVS